MLADKKRRWDERQSNGNEQTWVIIGAVSGALLGLALTLMS